MHEQQRKFFASKDRFRIASSRRYGSHAEEQKEMTLQAIDAMRVKSNLEIIAIDECKEMTKEDIERVRLIIDQYQPDFAFQHGFYSHALSEQDIDNL
jgi:hypothetical protein